MSFLQLVLSLDKDDKGNNSIMKNLSTWPISQHLPFFEWMFVMSVIAQLVLGGVFCGNQSNCRICRICRICILIGECWNGVDSLEILEHCRIAWKGWKVMNDWNVWNVSGATGVTGMSCRTHGCISRRSPCLLCVEFLESGVKVSLPSGM